MLNHAKQDIFIQVLWLSESENRGQSKILEH